MNDVVQSETKIYKNPSDADLKCAAAQVDTLYKVILDDYGNVYLWDGDLLYHQQVMELYGIPQELYCTADRFQNDQDGKQHLAEYIRIWSESVKSKRYIDGSWIK